MKAMSEGKDAAAPPRGNLSGRSIAVFGSSETEQGTEPYEEARRLGHRLATWGARLISGGYGGVMEAASRGAREAGGEAIGVTGSFFGTRSPNRWLSQTIPTLDLFERTRLLIEMSDAFIILPGKSGTIAELAFLWALHRAGMLGNKPVVLCGGIWPDLVAALVRASALEPQQRAVTILSPGIDDAIEKVARCLGPVSPERAGPAQHG